MSTTPRICLSSTSSILFRKKMHIDDTIINVMSIGRRRFHTTSLRSRRAIVSDVAEARCALDETRPDAQQYQVDCRDVHSLDA